MFTPAQVIFGYGLLSVAVGRASPSRRSRTLIVLNVAMSVFYLGNFIFKGILVSVGGGRSADVDQTIAIAARALRDDELPVFTVLVPMFREAADAAVLAQALRDLDYPLGKLDIKLVLEADDHDTIAVARTLGLEGVFEVIRVPPSQPQTKPKACNFALRFARGEYLVIYDAEDRPEPDQLRKVVATFRRSPPNTACLQCRLNYYNASENWLTRMFTLDYSLWFDQVLPGLERLSIPIPLGGTSNHFKIDVLRELHAWDPFNVTEDADLGIRLTPEGLSRRRRQLDHLRGSELPAPATGSGSARAGSRATCRRFLVHTRRPLHLHPQRPGRSAFSASCSSSAAPCCPACSIRSSGRSISSGWSLSLSGFDPVFPQILLFLSLFNLLAGNGAFIFLSMLAPIRRGWLDLIPYSLTVFGYWVLMSIAAYGRCGSSSAIRSTGRRPSTACRKFSPPATSARRGGRAVTRALAATPIAGCRLHGGAGAADASPCSTASCPTMR